MKKFFLMIVITVMTLTATFAQQGDRANQDGQRHDDRNQSGYTSHHYYKRSYHRRHRIHRDNGNNGYNNGTNGVHRDNGDHKDNGDHRN